MSKDYVLGIDRRLFLRGAGGMTLALPILPSLFKSSTAVAQAAQPRKCFVHLRTPHGGVASENMYPGDSALTETRQYTHAIRRGALTAPVNANGDAAISPVLTARSTVLTPALVAKMNVLRGLDIPIDLVHNFAGALGYYGRDRQLSTQPRATIDQIMSYSPAFYPSVASVRRRSVGIYSWSYGYRTPGVRSSGVSPEGIGGGESSLELFDTLLAGTTSSPTRAPIVDRVLDSYRRLRNGNKRLSQADKVRLDQHIDSVAELQRRLSTTLPADCQVPSRPSTDNLSLRPMDGNPPKNAQFFALINEVLAVALNCGATRVATLGIDENNQALTFTTRPAQGEDWHNNVVHATDSIEAAVRGPAKDLIRQFNQGFFSSVFMDLVSRLNSFSDGVGGTLLDHCLVAWGQESGNFTHDSLSMPVVTAGSASGAIKTGSYCDYRNLGVRLLTDPAVDSKWAGLLYNQWLTTALLAMGVPRSEWAETTHPGYGARMTYVDTGYFSYSGYSETQVYSEPWQKTGEILPFLV